ncbi:hypothetical protein HBI56_135650 [Parastagonospora nodorum]|nr:hypothetical protein HBH56_038740 [Parastagonospora nodorum]KAH3933525.1 hypothetical protein HBH54_060720 [Parastagonospora nodorum]KAH3941084.1 hypothetical protein HBH53_207560 [Parastagonospora nodorum]KAH3958030.1 hypothetical protein HBH51_215250 [Parastagonospora nodorum]KAH3958969.1 hypothetical protein HBH52_247950 [Parastagonospora nodorum]
MRSLVDLTGFSLLTETHRTSDVDCFKQLFVNHATLRTGTDDNRRQCMWCWHPHGFMVAISRRRYPDLQQHAHPSPAPPLRAGLS